MHNLIIQENIENLIYNIRGKEVMFDSDLARLYHCTNGTKDINKAVKRNMDKFPNDFYFQLSEEEYDFLRFQNGTSKKESRGGRQYLPFAFTEQGVAMLASVLKTKIASEVSINIMRAFVAMRHYINNNEYRLSNVETKLIKHDNDIALLQELFDKFNPKSIIKDYVFYEGDFYDSYSTFISIINESKEEIIIVDNYANRELLDMLRNINKNVIIVSKNIDATLSEKYGSQYKNVIFINNDSFHDRFIIVDRSIIYAIGASLKDIGKKCFHISRICEKQILDGILSRIFKE